MRIRAPGMHWLAIALAIGVTACSDDNGTGPNGNDDEAVLSGDITGTRTLDPDSVYTMRGIVRVQSGGQLIIPAGTLIQADPAVVPTALLVVQGGKLFSNGTASDPVVFTSGNPDGQRRRGDWGGVALQGYSSCNFDEDPCISEGVLLPFGGDDLADNSGTITYTRIEYCGYEVTFGNELNCLTLNGVGSGTQLSYIQTHYGSDDGFEWFGGTVDLKYAVATGISDDSFDYSTGWTGRGQFWIAQQDPADADWLYEVDGQEVTFTAQPYTIPTIYNVTLAGGGPSCADGNGLLQRRGTGGHLFNHIVTGACGVAFEVNNGETIARLNAGDWEIRNSIIFGNAQNFAAPADGIDEQALWNTAGWNNMVVDPQIAAPFNRTDPDFRLNAGSPAVGGGATPPSDGFFDTSATCIGAVCGQTEWYAGWTTTDQS